MAADRSRTVIKEIRDRPGDWLYHYTTLETALVYILPQRQLRLSPFSKMRDPREYKQWFPGAAGYIEDLPEAELMRRMAEGTRRVNLLRDEFKLLSLTVDSPDPAEGKYGRGYARSRLWELYAERGSGVCLVLDKKGALVSIPSKLEALGTADHKPVQYENSPTHTEVMFQFDELFGDLDLLAERIASRHLDKLFFTKNTEWESEREYRFVVRTPNEYEYVDLAQTLVAVVRGPESAADSEHVLGLVARELGIALGHLLWEQNDPILVGREVR